MSLYDAFGTGDIIDMLDYDDVIGIIKMRGFTIVKNEIEAENLLARDKGIILSHKFDFNKYTNIFGQDEKFGFRLIKLTAKLILL